MSEFTGPDRTAILKALDQVIDPKSGTGLTSAGLVRGLVLRSGRVAFMLEVAPGDIDLYRQVRDRAEAVLADLDGVESAQVVLTTEVQAPSAAPPPAGPGFKVSPRRPLPGADVWVVSGAGELVSVPPTCPPAPLLTLNSAKVRS